MKTTDEQRALIILETLYDLARGDMPADRSTIARWTGFDCDTIDGLLERLEAQHLVRADSCRLTMQGLVLAVSLAGSRKVARDAA